MNEGAQFAVVLERIGREVIVQLGDLPDETLNRPVPLPDANTLYALGTHLSGSTEFWVLQMAGGHDVRRHRLAEFRATGHGPDLVARIEQWIAAVHAGLDSLPDAAMNTAPPDPPEEYRASGGLGHHLTVRDCLLHAVEHASLHLGHIQITRQLLVDSVQSRERRISSSL